jgi:hypothetical protein
MTFVRRLLNNANALLKRYEFTISFPDGQTAVNLNIIPLLLNWQEEELRNRTQMLRESAALKKRFAQEKAHAQRITEREKKAERQKPKRTLGMFGAYMKLNFQAVRATLPAKTPATKVMPVLREKFRSISAEEKEVS